MASIVMKRNKDKNQKQLTLGAFNFTKTITHWNGEVSVEISKISRTEVSITKHVKCPNCESSSMNNHWFPLAVVEGKSDLSPQVTGD